MKRSLGKAGQLKYIDLVLLHAPFGGKEGRLGAWKALVEAVEAGTVRSIGVSNYGVQVRHSQPTQIFWGEILILEEASRRAREIHQRNRRKARQG